MLFLLLSVLLATADIIVKYLQKRGEFQLYRSSNNKWNLKQNNKKIIENGEWNEVIDHIHFVLKSNSRYKYLTVKTNDKTLIQRYTGRGTLESVMNEAVNNLNNQSERDLEDDGSRYDVFRSNESSGDPSQSEPITPKVKKPRQTRQGKPGHR
eukprot:NODE_724_length_4442_cov_0.403868.p3 type:complete len:153 gc:universal NODE_724_length_4442_cov_0.403868:926-1384(+)